ncbi:JmjC-domain-containing protein, partial [Neoconidiobolus thromboides FSU 785]
MGKKCELCLGGELKTDAMVQCETCQDYYHLGCFELKINVVFLPPFFCPVCLKNYEPSFGFDSGNGYYLNEFMTKANDFYQEYLIQKLRITDSQSNKRNNKVLPLNKEKEFWHHIDNPVVDLQVETANDLQSSYQGSGFTTAEINPHDPIATHPWNLNNIGNSPSNVLSNLQDKHSGMNVPWAYITMLFSTHCWHTDDHFAYSINYQHWGESKRYYSIPSNAAYEFEAFFKQLAPSLFKNDPELMYQLITMVSPQDIQKAGIPIYTCEQKAGEFVITLPQSYSCWYSNGFSFNESIYYAPYDWISFGLKSKIDYQLQNRMPVFCFEELLL